MAASESGLSLVDASAGVADLLSCKDATEVLNVKKAAMLASKVGGRAHACMHPQGGRGEREGRFMVTVTVKLMACMDIACLNHASGGKMQLCMR